MRNLLEVRKAFSMSHECICGFKVAIIHTDDHVVIYVVVHTAVVYEMRTLSRFVSIDIHNWLSAFTIAFLNVLAHLSSCARGVHS